MIRKLLFIGSISIFAMACGGNNANVATGNSTNANTAVNSAANPAGANKPANTTAAKPAPSGPTRVSFKKGEVSSTQSIDLAPGASVQFVLGATGNQTLIVESKSNDLSFKMLKGLGDVFSRMEDGGYIANTKGNNGVKGDINFEVKNTSAKAVKTSIRIEIQDAGD